MRTWQFEAAMMCAVLSGVAKGSGGDLKDWLSALAVFFTFLHAQVGFRVDEAPVGTKVECLRWMTRYYVIKEILWFAFFVLSGAWPALVGTVVFLAYPAWRRWRGSRPRGEKR